MKTVTQIPAELDPAAVRLAAILAIGTAVAPADLRARSAGTPQEITDKQLADEAEYLAARGVTKRVASRVLAGRDREHGSRRGYRYSDQDARQVAKLYLTGMTPTRLRQHAALRGTPAERRGFAAIADAMDKLLAEGFDAAAYKRELAESCAGAR